MQRQFSFIADHLEDPAVPYQNAIAKQNRFLISETASCQYFYLFLPGVAFYDRKLRSMP